MTGVIRLARRSSVRGWWSTHPDSTSARKEYRSSELVDCGSSEPCVWDTVHLQQVTDGSLGFIHCEVIDRCV